MPIVVSILQTKGGSGKTTLATNLAHALALDGETVLLVDADPQGSARDWHEANGGALVDVVGLDRKTLERDVASQGKGYDWVLIDGPAKAQMVVSAAIRAADIVLIPVRPSPYDIWGCAELLEAIKGRQEAANGKPTTRFVVSQAVRRTKLTGDIGSTLDECGFPALSHQVVFRQAYPTTAIDGLTVLTQPNSPGAREIQGIKEEVKQLAQDQTKKRRRRK